MNNKLTVKYTPGPWAIGGPDDAYIFAGTDASEKRIAEIVEDDLDSGYDYCSTEEADANARLIAAAPEMLEALQVAETVLILLKHEVEGLRFNGKNVLPRVQTAIRKAKGEL